MMDLTLLFKDHFENRQHSVEELMRYTPEHLIRLNAHNAGSELDVVVADVQSKFTAYATCLGDKEFQAAARQSANQSKAVFREGLRVPIGKCAAAVEAAFGKPSPDYTACFPEGREGILRAAEGILFIKLTALLNALGSRTAAVGISAQVTAITALRNTWSTLLAASTTADTTEETTDTEKAALRKELTVALSRSALFCAYTFFEDMVKANALLPLNLLRNPEAASVPGKPTYSAEYLADENQILNTMTATGTTQFVIQKETAGVFNDIVENAETGFQLGDLTPATTYRLRVIGINDAGRGEPSDPVDVVVP
jgi:hypothetical protein